MSINQPPESGSLLFWSTAEAVHGPESAWTLCVFRPGGLAFSDWDGRCVHAWVTGNPRSGGSHNG